MLHKVKDGTRVVGFVDGEPYKLQALHSIVIPALCAGAIPHGITVESFIVGDTPALAGHLDLSFVMLVGEPEVLTSHNLIICPRPVVDGDVFTYVFNLSNEQLRIRKGEVVSRLVRIAGSTWL